MNPTLAGRGRTQTLAAGLSWEGPACRSEKSTGVANRQQLPWRAAATSNQHAATSSTKQQPTAAAAVSAPHRAGCRTGGGWRSDSRKSEIQRERRRRRMARAAALHERGRSGGWVDGWGDAGTRRIRAWAAWGGQADDRPNRSRPLSRCRVCCAAGKSTTTTATPTPTAATPAAATPTATPPMTARTIIPRAAAQRPRGIREKERWKDDDDDER
jgi:hypothetical protein